MELSHSEMITTIMAILSLLILCVAGFVVWRFVRGARQRNYVVRLEDVVTQVLFPARCPKCSMPMESGFMLVGQGLHFRLDSEPARRRTSPLTAVPNTMNMSMKTLENKAWRCPRCKLLLLDYNYQIIPEKNDSQGG